MSLLLLFRGNKESSSGVPVTPSQPEEHGFSDGPDTPRPAEVVVDANVDIQSIIKVTKEKKVAPPTKVKFKLAPPKKPPVTFKKTEKAKAIEAKLEALKQEIANAKAEDKKREAKAKLPEKVKFKKAPPKPGKKSQFKKIETFEEKLERLERAAEQYHHNPLEYLRSELLPEVLPGLLSARTPFSQLPQLTQAYPEPVQPYISDEKMVEVLSRVDDAQSELEVVEALSEL